MGKMTSRGLARRELERANEQLASFAEHIEKVYGTHYNKGLEDVDEALDTVKLLIGQASTIVTLLRDRL